MAESPRPAPDVSLPFGATVTILFSDIRGFTEYTNQYGDEAAFRVLQHHNALVRRQIERFGGHVVKTQGDSFMVSFTTARGAILCAIAVQRAIAESNQDQEGTRIAVGIGINTGEPIQEGGDFFGSTVNLAARICAVAGPGQVLISETTRFVAGRIEAIDYVDRGMHALKGFDEPHRLYEVVWSLPGPAAPPPAPATEETPSGVLESAVQRAIGVLNRVLAVAHRDDPTFRPLLECQAKASDLRLALSRAVTERRGYTAQRVDEAMLPFADLLALVEGQEELDDQRWAHLEASVSRVFGRQLAIAATRGRLVLEGADQRPVEPARREPASIPRVPEPPARAVPQPLPPVPPTPLDPRASGVPWWKAAHEAWIAWKTSGMAWAHALRAAMARHPHLLGVPIQESADHDGGRLADGYFLLLEHAENRSPGFLLAAAARAVEAAGGSSDPAVLGPALYETLVAGGRLAETYAEFVRDVMIAAIPNPGAWLDGGVTESDDATVVVVRTTGTVGDPGERPERITEPRERGHDRRFTVTAAPLTTRFFAVHQGDLKSPRDVELKLTEEGAASDRAWYLTQRTGHVLHSEPRRLPAAGLVLPGLGRDFAAVWVAIFNPDPRRAARFELSVGVKGPGQLASGRSPFARPRAH